MLEKDKIHVSMIGGCVIRDGLGFFKDAGYKVDRFTQSSSPISSIDAGSILAKGKKINETGLLELDEFSGYSNFIKRDFTLDIERGILDYVFDVESEYLIIDMAGFRRNLIKFIDGDKSIYFTDNDSWYKNAVDVLTDKGYIDMDYQCIDSNDEIIPLIEKNVCPYLDKLLEHYPRERIVLLDFHATDYYIDNGILKAFPKDYGISGMEERTSAAFNIAREYLKGCHVIEFPKYVFADKGHKWGLSRGHYIKQYYEYVYRAYNIIMREKNDPETENNKLRLLKKSYEKKFKEMFNTYLFNTLSLLTPKVCIADSCTEYCNYYESLLMEPGKLTTSLIQFMKSRGYSSCAIYGYTRIAKLYINILRNNGIKVDFIFENSTKKAVQGIPLCRRGAKQFPETDVIIITDIMNIDVIKERYSKNTNIPFVDVYDIIK